MQVWRWEQGWGQSLWPLGLWQGLGSHSEAVEPREGFEQRNNLIKRLLAAVLRIDWTRRTKAVPGVQGRMTAAWTRVVLWRRRVVIPNIFVVSL